MPRWPQKENPTKPVEVEEKKEEVKSSEPVEGTNEFYEMMAQRNRDQMLKATNPNDVKAFQSLEDHYRSLIK